MVGPKYPGCVTKQLQDIKAEIREVQILVSGVVLLWNLSKLTCWSLSQNWSFGGSGWIIMIWSKDDPLMIS